MSELWQKSAIELASAVRDGTLGPDQIFSAHRDRVTRWDPAVHALLAQRSSPPNLSHPPRGPLAGVPVVIKDNICTEGMTTTCGSRILKEYRPPYDATVVRRLKEAGAYVLAKSNCDEFAMGSSTENSAFGPTLNPYDLARVPGGSSGGSAVAVATGMAPIALGSETGGSVRQPASFTDLVGLKPTYGRLSRYGLVAFGSSLDQVGLLSRTVGDMSLLFSVLAGADPFDMTSLPDSGSALPPEKLDNSDGRKFTIGIPREILKTGVDPDVLEALSRTEERLKEAGVRIVESAIPSPQECVATYYLIATAEASSNLSRFDGVRYGYRSPQATDLESLYSKTRGEGFGPEVIRRIVLGTFALSSGYYDAYYLRALRARARIQEQTLAALEDVDALLLPVSPTPAFPLGQRVDDPLTMYLSDLFTITANLAGTPALSVPAGFSGAGLPIGMQLMGAPEGEETLLQIAGILESLSATPHRWPSEPGSTRRGDNDR